MSCLVGKLQNGNFDTQAADIRQTNESR